MDTNKCGWSSEQSGQQKVYMPDWKYQLLRVGRGRLQGKVEGEEGRREK